MYIRIHRRRRRRHNLQLGPGSTLPKLRASPPHQVQHPARRRTAQPCHPHIGNLVMRTGVMRHHHSVIHLRGQETVHSGAQCEILDAH